MVTFNPAYTNFTEIIYYIARTTLGQTESGIDGSSQGVGESNGQVPTLHLQSLRHAVATVNKKGLTWKS